MSFKISDNIIGFEEELSFFLNLYTNSALTKYNIISRIGRNR